MINRAFGRFLAVFFCMLSISVAYAIDNRGTEFIFAFNKNVAFPSAQQSLIISSDVDTQGTIEIPGIGFTETFTVQANQITTVVPPARIDGLLDNERVSLGVHVIADNEITLYGLNSATATTDAFTALPVDVLGKEYFVAGYDGTNFTGFFGPGHSPAQVAIVATEDNTLVEVVPPTGASSIGGLAEKPFTITLNKFDVYQFVSNRNFIDLTGTYIKASFPVAVMSGNLCANIPSNVSYCDHITEMLPPIETWGNNFVITPLATRLQGSLFRVLASEDQTSINIDGVEVAILNSGEFYETLLNTLSEVSASKPVMVTQYSLGSTFDNTVSDPFMMVIPPIDQFLDAYSFTTPESGFVTHFVNVVIPTSGIDSLRLNDVAVDSALFSTVGTSSLSAAQIPLVAGSYTLNAGQLFGIYLYGFGSDDSYGYPGGMALNEINLRSDSFAPVVNLQHVANTFIGTVTDSEDLNGDIQLDAGEDSNGNGVLDARTEDINGNNVLDAGEDVNANNIIDRDLGLLKVELLPGSENIEFQVVESNAIIGKSRLDIRIDLIDQLLPGSGRLKVEDLGGNVIEKDIFIPVTPVLADVHLVNTVPNAGIVIDQASFSHVPYKIDEQNDKTIIEWRFETFSADQIENVGFDVILQDPQAGEEHLITKDIQLSYVSAPGAERTTVDLGQQSVFVSNSSFDLTASTDQSNVEANANIQLQVQVSNQGTTANTASIEFIVEDLNSVPVVSFPSEPIAAIAPGASLSINQSWNTGLFVAGTYQLHAILRSDDGRILNESFSPFAIVGSTVGLPQLAADVVIGTYISDGVFVAKNTYHTSDVVLVQSQIKNLTDNAFFSNSALRVSILNPLGQPLFVQESVINAEIVPGAIQETINNFMLNNAIPGAYQVQVLLSDVETSAILASSNSSFTVAQDIALSVEGLVQAQLNELLLGDTQSCTDTISSLVASPLASLEIQTSLFNITTGQQLDVKNSLISLAANASQTTNRTIDTTTSGDFVCILSVNTGTELRVIGLDAFRIFNLIANPGGDMTAFVGQQVVLNGAASREANGIPLNYQWRFVSKPLTSNAVLANPDSVTPGFLIDEQGQYIVELIVNNGNENSVPKWLVIDVPNRLPVSKAGPDQAVSAGDTALLEGAGSFDLDGDELSFQWQIIHKPLNSQSQLSAADIANPTLQIDVSGVYLLQLVVNDGFGDSQPDTIVLSAGNLPPVADAGENIAAFLGDTITLDGSLSTDANGDDLSYAWFFDSMPVGSNTILTNNATVKPTFSIDKAGTYTIRLTVNDGLKDSTPDTVDVIIGNAAPVADAGENQSGFAGDFISLDGSASRDANDDPLSYRWNTLARPVNSNAQLNNPFLPNPLLVLDEQGDYIVQLIVNDGTEDSQPDVVVISSNNLPPTANAEFNGTGEIFTGDVITLNGTNSFDPEGSLITYQWSFVESPTGSIALFDDANAASPTFTIDRSGDYVAQLIVNDGQIDSEPATVLIQGAQACVDDLAIRPKYDKIQLTWTYNPDIEIVELLRSTNLDGPYELLATTDSTYATYLDAGLAFGPNYYYQIKGVFPVADIPPPPATTLPVGEPVACRPNDSNSGGGILDGILDPELNTPSRDSYLCGDNNIECEFGGFSELGIQLICGVEQQACGFISNDQVICEAASGAGSGNSCPAVDGDGEFNFCEFVCELYAEDPEGTQQDFEEFAFDFGQCGSPGSGSGTDPDPDPNPVPGEARVCKTQIIASTPVGRVRLTIVPDVSGMSVAQAEATLQLNRLTLGNVTFERTTAVPTDQVIRQDVPRNSMMPTGTAIDLIMSTRGVTGQ